MKPKVLLVVGPTATGKSELGLELAKRFGGEIISADSMQVYRLMDIGTAKPSPEVRQQIPHHLIDLVWPDETFSAGLFRKMGREAIQEIVKRGRLPIVVGGTGLYIKALTEGLIEGLEGQKELREDLLRKASLLGKRALWEELKEVDPESASRIHPNDLYRVIRALEIYRLTGVLPSKLRESHSFKDRPYELLKIGLKKSKEELLKRIEERVKEMIKRGLVEEVRELLQRGYGPELPSLKAIGYKEIILYLKGEIGLEEATRLIVKNTWQLARRQMMWFKRDKEIKWFEYPEEQKEILNLVEEFLKEEKANGAKTEKTH